MNRIVFCLLLAVGTTSAASFATGPEVKLFEEFEVMFERRYTTAEERLDRYNVFKDNLKRINELNNSTGGTAVYSHLTQWTPL